MRKRRSVACTLESQMGRSFRTREIFRTESGRDSPVSGIRLTAGNEDETSDADGSQSGTGSGLFHCHEDLVILFSSLRGRKLHEAFFVTSFRMSSAHFAALVKRERNDFSWEFLTQSLSLLPLLEDLIVGDPDNEASSLAERELSPPSLRALFANLRPCLPRLKRIEIHVEHSIDPEHIGEVATLVATATLLEEVVLSRISLENVWPSDSVNLGPLLLPLSTRKHLRRVHIGRTGHGTFSPLLCKESVQAISSSATLQELYLDGLNLSDADYKAFASGLSGSTSLKKVGIRDHFHSEQERLQEHTLSNQTGFDFVHVMASNFAMESLTLSQRHQSPMLWRQQLESFCVLNQRRRKRVIQDVNASPYEWFYLFSAVRDDVNALYYLLTENPLVLTHQGGCRRGNLGGG